MKDYAVYFRLLREPALLLELTLWKTFPIREELFKDLLSISPLNNRTNSELTSNLLYDKGSDISVGIIKYLLKKQLKFLEKMYENDEKFSIDIFPIDKNANYDASYTYPKAILMEKIEEAYNQGQLTEEEYASVTNLREKVTYEKMIMDYKTETINCKSTRGEYNIPFTLFLEILSLPPKVLEEKLKNDSIAGIPKEEFVYSLNTFFRTEHLFQKYMFPHYMIINQNYMSSMVDTMALEKIFIQLPKYTSEVEVDNQLWNEILDKVPNEFTKLEKAYYIYYQLCKMFTYDEEYFALGGKVPKTSEHFDVNHIKQINASKNDVICYEFNAIYSKFLDSLGIPYEYVGAYSYGEGHTHLNCVIDEFYISVDSTFSVIYGDMPAAKQNLSLNGFRILNDKENTKEKFKQSIVKVNEYIKKESENEQAFESLIKSYQDSEGTISDCLSSEERFEILLTSIETCTLPPTDSLGYINTMTKNLFSYERKKCCKNLFVRDTEPPEIRNKNYGVSVIICYNPIDINENTDNNQYYIYTPMVGIKQVTKEELERQFFSEKYQYITTYEDTIPGINYTGGSENVEKTTGNSK